MVIKKHFILFLGAFSLLQAASYTADDAYRVLGLKNPSSAQEIKKAYRKLALKHHPDKGGNEEMFKALGKAYTFLNPESSTFASSNTTDHESYDSPAGERRRKEAEERAYKEQQARERAWEEANASYEKMRQEWEETDRAAEAEIERLRQESLKILTSSKKENAISHYLRFTVTNGYCQFGTFLFFLGVHISVLKEQWVKETLKGTCTLSLSDFLKKELKRFSPHDEFVTGKIITLIPLAASIYLFRRNGFGLAS